MARGASWDEAAADSLLGLCVVLTVVALVFTVWLIVKVVELLVRVFTAHPTNKTLLGTVVTSAALFLAVGLTSGQYESVDVLAGASPLVLIAVAAVLDIADDTRLRRPLNRDTAVHAVLHEWWPAA
jgi:hypothetical protein